MSNGGWSETSAQFQVLYAFNVDRFGKFKLNLGKWKNAELLTSSIEDESIKVI